MNTRLILVLALLCHGLASAPSAWGQVYEKVFSFTQERAADVARSGNRGAYPASKLVLGGDGSFYGSTQGGSAPEGMFPPTIYRLSAEGEIETLYTFPSSFAAPGFNGGSISVLARGADGNFYGTTYFGGAANQGTIFRLTPGGTLTTLVEMTGATGAFRGGRPNGLILGPDGNFYGTAGQDGSGGLGTVFRLTPAGAFTTVADFPAGSGAGPETGLTLGSDGNFYGVLRAGGAFGVGSIYRVTLAGAISTVHDFDSSDPLHPGFPPEAVLTDGGDGFLYGTTRSGGLNSAGTVFRVSTTGAFATVAQLGAVFPPGGGMNYGELIRGGDGMFYGVGSPDFGAGGKIFRVTPGGEVTALADFTGSHPSYDGYRPRGGLVQGSDGLLYGTTLLTNEGNFSDEHAGFGTVFRVATSGAVETLVRFAGVGRSAIGSGPTALVAAADGDFYGTTRNGGASEQGTVFQLTPDGRFSTLVEFTGSSGETRGDGPRSLIQARDGSLWGTTEAGGLPLNNAGTVFKITPAGVFTTVVDFDNATTGSTPTDLVEGSDGNLYGTAYQGGAGSGGTIFRISPSGTFTKLHDFEFSFDGLHLPFGKLVETPGGDFIGTTNAGGIDGEGAIYKVSPTGVFSVLRNLGYPPAIPAAEFIGTRPGSGLTAGADGNFYGAYTGPLFRITASGALTVLGQGEISAAGGLVQGADGFFYGAGTVGAVNTIVYKISVAGALTTLIDLAQQDSAEGSPGQLQFGPDGNLYGLSQGAAFGTGGAVFRIILPGAPSVYPRPARVTGETSIRVEAKLNARGAATQATLEYGTDGVLFPTQVPLAANLAGYQTTLVGTTLSNLATATTYHYRIRAVSSAGTTVTLVQSFSTLAEPVMTVGAASGITATSATFNGTVNARSFDTTVVFEWGTDGNSFPNTAPATPGTVPGNTPVPVSAAVAALPAGGTVFYRLRATNVAGTATSGTRSFSTVSVTTSNPLPEQVGVSDVVFRATIDTFGQSAAVKFKYWADSAPLTVLETVPQAVPAFNGPREVTERVTGLLENVSYSYRVSVELAGTETDGGVVMFTTDTNIAPVAMADVVFYTGQVQFDPLANDSDANGDALVLDPVLAVPPTVAAAVASVTPDRLFISYNPQNNVTDEDTLTYSVLDPQGASATALVRLIAFSKRAGFYSGRAEFSGGATTRSLAVSLQFGTSGAVSTAFFNWAGETYRLKGVFDPSGRLTRTIDLVNLAGSKLTLTLRLDPDVPLIHGSVVERDGGNVVVANVPDFTLTQNAGTGGLPEAGLRTAFLSPPASLAAQMGDGYVVMNVAKNRRSARFAGQLPDGEPFLASAPAQGRSFSLSKALEQRGSLTGLVRMIGTETDAAGMMANLFWQKRASGRARFFRGAIGTNLELLGMEYPALARNALPPIDLGSGSPNARLRFSGGDLASALDFPLHIAAGSVTGFDASRLRLKLDPALGKFRGKFLHPATGRLVPFGGALRVSLDTEPGQGRGVFRGPSTAGAVRIEGL